MQLLNEFFLFSFIILVHGDEIPKLVDDKLVFVHTLCRHGDRNNYPSYPSDPWNSEKYWPGGFGELTNLGKQQHYALGEYLKIRYAKLIGDDGYSPQKVYVKSTDIDRTLMGAQVTLAGLFPPNPQQKWNDNFNWHPIPVHTEPRKQDSVLAPEKPCARYDYEMLKYANTSEYKSLFIRNKAVIDELEANAGIKLRSFLSLNHFFDKLFIEKLKGYRLPTWAQEAMDSGELEYLATFFYSVLTHSTEMKKLKCGYLLKEILDRFKAKVRSTLSPDRCLWMYFVHDTTIAALLDCVGLFELHRPPYASCLFFELYKTETENYVQLFYRNSTDINVPAMEIPNCGVKCSLDKWYELYENILPTQTYDEECKLRENEVLPNMRNPEFKPIDT